MGKKDFFPHFFLVPAILSLLLAACLPGIVSPPYVITKSDQAGCHSGPGNDYSLIAALGMGKKAHIFATIRDQSWWEIGDPAASQTRCWIPAGAVDTNGLLSGVPIVPVPSGLVIALTISGPPVIPAVCSNGLPNQVSFKISITTDGPALVTYHTEVYHKNESMVLIHSDNTTLAFTSASTRILNPGATLRTDCGDFIIKLIVTSPNVLAAQAGWLVVGH